MKALSIHAGARALAHLRQKGLNPSDIALVPAAAGGPKGLILTHLDRHVFGHWLVQSSRPIDLVGASIGAWRMAAGMTADPRATFEQFASGYANEHHEPPAGKRLPSPAQLSEGMRGNLRGMFATHLPFMFAHPTFRLHVLTSRGRGLLHQAGKARAALGFSALAMGNALSRRFVGGLMERVVFSMPGNTLPLPLLDLPTRRAELHPGNFYDVVQASSSIPFLFPTVRNIDGAPPGAFWDGGIIDYHLHWDYNSLGEGLVLYPHFQSQVIAGWLDKPLKWRKAKSAHLSNVILLAPNPQWVASLPAGKLPDRGDLTNLSFHARHQAWGRAIAEAQRLADEFAAWLDQGSPTDAVHPL